ncbi:MAG: hypothetical protein Q9159_000143 [Coniocarpon cinnabarinum]
MLLLGLTGSIATGKSTVSDLLRSEPYNLPIVDADVLARRVVEPGTPGYQKILESFASTTPDLLVPAGECGGFQDGPNGKGRPLNRPALGRRVFGGSEEAQQLRKTLNGIVHPAVRRAMWIEMAQAYIRGSWACVLDIPLLYESNWERLCGSVMVVAVKDPKLQTKRLKDRDAHLTDEDARNRVLSQMDVREKAERCLQRGQGAGVVIWNDGDKEDLKQEVSRVMREVRRNSPTWWTWLLWLVPPAAMSAALYSFLRSWLIQRRWQRQKEREKAKL